MRCWWSMRSTLQIIEANQAAAQLFELPAEGLLRAGP